MVNRQQATELRVQRAEEAARDNVIRSENRRFDAYADFHTQARRFRNAIRSYIPGTSPIQSVADVEVLANSADAASSLVFLVLESAETLDACRAAVRTINSTIKILHESAESNLNDAPWDELNTNMALAIRVFQKAARAELGVSSQAGTSS